MVHHNKYFTFNYKGQFYRGRVVDYALSFADMELDLVIKSSVKKYLFFGPLEQRIDYKHIGSLTDTKRPLDRRYSYDPVRIKNLCIGMIDEINADQHDLVI